MFTNGTLLAGQSLKSATSTHMVTLTLDGDLVASVNGVAYWHTNTSGSGATVLLMGADCNLALYKQLGDATPVFSSGTAGQGSNCFMIMQSDDNVVVYNKLPDGGTRFVWNRYNFPQGNLY